ncbi:hypothetical protein LXL04_009480 [Taraxacum kok-saghyz]
MDMCNITSRDLAFLFASMFSRSLVLDIELGIVLDLKVNNKNVCENNHPVNNPPITSNDPVEKSIDSVDICNDFENNEFVDKNKPNDSNIFDHWTKKGPNWEIDTNTIFPKDAFGRHFYLNFLRVRFEQMQHFESIYVFLFDGSKLISLLDGELKKLCLNLQFNLTNGEESDKWK